MSINVWVKEKNNKNKQKKMLKKKCVHKKGILYKQDVMGIARIKKSDQNNLSCILTPVFVIIIMIRPSPMQRLIFLNLKHGRSIK